MKKIESLLVRSLDAPLSGAEKRHLESVLRESSEARDMLRQFRAVRGELAALSTSPNGFDTSFVDDVMRSVALDESAAPDRNAGFIRPRPAPLRLLSRPVVWAAAAALLLTLVGYGYWRTTPVVHVPAPGTAVALDLPDGSVVQLAAGSTLRRFRSARPGAVRAVSLTGEAFFDVAPDGPFIIRTPEATIHVTGTRFNVRAWPEGERTVVSVEEGSVVVMPNRREGPGATTASAEETATDRGTPAAATTLSAGQAMIITPDGQFQRWSAAATHAFVWLDGGFGFHDEPASAVFSDLERRYNIVIDRAAVDLSDRRITYLRPSDGSPSQVMDDLSHTLELSYRKTVDGYALFIE